MSRPGYVCIELAHKRPSPLVSPNEGVFVDIPQLPAVVPRVNIGGKVTWVVGIYMSPGTPLEKCIAKFAKNSKLYRYMRYV